MEEQYGVGIADLANQFLNSRLPSQIVGRHGTGKTTIAVQIARKLANQFEQIDCFVFRPQFQSRSLFSIFDKPQIDWYESPQINSARFQCVQPRLKRMWVVDGIEWLNWTQQSIFLAFAVANRTRLILTTHRKIFGARVLARTISCFSNFEALAADRLANQPGLIDTQDIQSAFDQSKGNYRDAFLLLYDLFESRVNNGLDLPLQPKAGPANPSVTNWGEA